MLTREGFSQAVLGTAIRANRRLSPDPNGHVTLLGADFEVVPTAAEGPWVLRLEVKVEAAEAGTLLSVRARPVGFVLSAPATAALAARLRTAASAAASGEDWHKSDAT